MLKQISYVITFFVFYSCASPHQIVYPKRADLNPMERWNAYCLNGYYKNYTADSGFTNNTTIWNILTTKNKYYTFDTTLTFKNGIVELLLERVDVLIGRLYVDDKLVQEKRFYGEIKNGYFVAEPKRKFFGFPGFYYKESDTGFQIGIDKSERLLIDAYNGGGACLFILCGGSLTDYNFIFQKK